MLTKPIRGIVFVHGINQTADDLAHMDDWVHQRLERFGLADLFIDLNGAPNVWIAKWRSLGSFVGDLEDLARHKERRDQAVADVQAVIKRAWEALAKQASAETTDAANAPKMGLLVVGHSMGQPLALAALHGLQQQMKLDLHGLGTMTDVGSYYPVPTSLLTIGGPLANDEPGVRYYLGHGLDGSPWVRSFCPSKPPALREWIDVFNPLDPVAQGPFFGSSTYPGSTHQMFKVPGQPDFVLPGISALATYHSAYFDHPEIFQTASRMLDELVS